jgi:peptidoglycan-associated lipoprotein
MRTFAIASLFALVGCAHPKAETKTAAEVHPPAAAPAPPPQAQAQSSCGRDAECGDGQLCIDGRCVAITDNLAACTSVKVHFGFNAVTLDDGEKAGLERAARCLKADRALSIRVEGNADERGTEEYNLALADKRARVVVDYLHALGAPDRQLKTLSYGEENPVCTDHDEQCWQANRRADLALASNKPAKPRHK